jgi:DNA polymerase-3 subunit alpha
MENLERLGLIKMDFLGLRNLTVIRYCENYIKQREPNFNIENIPIDDQEVYSMLAKGKTLGVFQFESTGITNVLKRLIPRNIEDLIAVLSLYRPGPMDSIPKYIENRHHPERITYKTPQLKSILEVTYGCIVYQEQVMEIFRSLADYSYARADIVRRAMSKKKHEVMLQERESFVQGCGNHNISSEVANSIFDEMVSFSSYAFNKSHATCYAHIAYQTAYLRCHYFTEYMASLMSSVLTNTAKLMEYITECESNGVKVLSPHINESYDGFTVSDNQIRFGLLAIKNIGKGMIDSIVKERELNGKYTSIKDFCKRNDTTIVNRRAIESLIKAGAFDGLGYNRHEMLSNLDRLVTFYQERINTFDVEGQLDLFGEMSMVANKEVNITSMEEYPTAELLSMEYEVTGTYISGHPLKDYSKYTEILGLNTVTSINDAVLEGKNLDNCAIVLICQITDVKLNRNSTAFLVVEDVLQSINCVVMSSLYESFKSFCTKDSIVFIRGKVSTRQDRISIFVNDMIPIDKFIGNPCFYLNAHFNRLVLDIDSGELNKTAELCAKLDAQHGNTSIEVHIMDKKQRFTPKSKPKTSFNSKTLALLEEYQVKYKFLW